jgi:hypothetical protein
MEDDPMQKSELPFFTRFLEPQRPESTDELRVRTAVKAGGLEGPPEYVTLKYPSDGDDYELS